MQAAQPAADRRTKRGARVPLDVLVELSHDDHAEPFEADGVTLSRGGLSLRAAYLPEVGSRLACRFECPPDGAPIEAACEVVWAEGSGEHAGEFGVRFLEASEGADDRIRAFVRAMAGDAEEVRDTARLYIDGIETPIVARVSHRADDLVTVEQELTFLSLGKGLALRDGDRARRGQIASIDLQLTGDVPRLVLQVLYDDELPEEVEEPSLPVALTSDRTDPDLQAPSYDREADVADVEDVAVERAQPSEALDTPVPAAPRRKERETAQVVRTHAAAERALVQPEGLIDTGEGEKPLPAGAGLLAVWAAMAIARVVPWLAKARAVAWPLLRRAWERSVAATRVAMREAGPRLRPVSAAVRRTTLPLLGSAKTMILRRTSRAATPVRRTTAPPPAALDVRGLRPTTGRVALQREDVAPVARPRRNKLGRPLAIGVAALALAGLFVWFVTSGDDDDGVPLPRTAAATASPAPTIVPAPALPAQETGLAGAGAPVPPGSAPVTIQAPTELPPAAELVAPTPVVAPPPAIDPPMPTALGAPSYVAGHLPAPTYPTLDGAPRPASAPATVPVGSPYAVDAREHARGVHAGMAPPHAAVVGAPGTHVAVAGVVPPASAGVAHPSGALARSIGAPTVRNARSFTLHLTSEPQGLEGGPTANGFAIRIRGALSLDPAAPLAASHPAVGHAVVINRHDHADLQIVFKDGMHPAFRVAARGATIEILIAPR